MDNPDPLMTTTEVAEMWGIEPQSVYSTARRYGLVVRRGWVRAEVEAVVRPGRGRRTDLQRED